MIIRMRRPTRLHERRSRLSMLVVLSLAAFGCAEPDSQEGAPPVSGETPQGLTTNRVTVTPVAGSDTTATVAGSDAVGAVSIATDARAPTSDEPTVEQKPDSVVITFPGMPSITVSTDGKVSGPGVISGPTVVDVTRTPVTSAPSTGGPTVVDVTRTPVTGADTNGPAVIDVTRTPVTGATGGQDDEDGKVVVTQGADKTTITVPGFPTITLTPDPSSDDGAVTVSVPGLPTFTIPKGAVIEAPGGITIVR